MQATFLSSADDKETEGTTLFGVEFPRGEVVDVSHLSDVQKAKLVGNKTFQIGDGEGVPPLDVLALRVQLDALGVKYHHAAGAAKLSALLEANTPKVVEEND